MIRAISKFITFCAIAMMLILAYIKNVNDSPSIYELAAKNLGFNHEKRKTLLEVFIISGYFKQDKALEDILQSKAFGEYSTIIFKKELLPLIDQSKAYLADPFIVDIRAFEHHLFGRSKFYFWKSSTVNISQVENWLLYIAHNDFTKNTGKIINISDRESWLDSYIQSLNSELADLKKLKNTISNI